MKRSLQLILGLFLSILTSSVATGQTAELRSLSPQDVRQLQIDLTQVGRDVGFASGEMNAATEQAFIEFADEQNLSSTDFTRVMQRLTARAERARWNEVKHFFDDFSEPAFRSDETRSRNYWNQQSSRRMRYHPTNGYRPYANFQPYQYVEEENGNTYMRIEAMNGMNVQQPGIYKDECASVTIWDWEELGCDTEADKFELDVRDDFRRPFQGIINKELWVGFRIREGEIFETHPQAYSNVFQIKLHPWGQVMALKVGAGDSAAVTATIFKEGFGGSQDDRDAGNRGGITDYIKGTTMPWKDAQSYHRWVEDDDGIAIPIVASPGCHPPYSSVWQTLEGREAISGINPLPNNHDVPPFIDHEGWTTYKIGIFHTEDEDGFMAVYQNDKLVFEYCGPTKRGYYRPDIVDVRIGLYRSHNPNVNLEQVVHYDDLTVVGSKAMLDAYLGYGNLGPNGVPQ